MSVKSKADHEKSFNCSQCEKSFKLKLYLLKHIERVHKFKCHHKNLKGEKCKISFKHKKSLTHHIKKVHQNVIHYQCKYCDKGFYKKCDWKRHHRVHTGEKPFQCQTCHKRYGRKDVRNNHQKKCQNY
eukprot:98679_1